MTVTGYAPDNLAPMRPDGTGIPARRTAFDDLAGQAARLPWCWPALLTLAFGFYQVGRPELWRDELASWSFASRSVPELIAAARHTGATQLADGRLRPAVLPRPGYAERRAGSAPALHRAHRGRGRHPVPGTLYPEPCPQPAACLGAERRIWVIGVGRQTSPYQAVTPAQAAVLRPRYRLMLVKHQRSLTMFLLTRVS